MRTPKECLIKAAELELLADDSTVAEVAAEYLEMAAYWRDLARWAAREGFAIHDYAAAQPQNDRPTLH